MCCCNCILKLVGEASGLGGGGKASNVYLFDLDIELSHFLHPTSVIIGPSDSIDSVLQVSAKSQASATSMPIDDSRESVPL